MKLTIALLLFFSTSGLLLAQPIIDSTNWPYGTDFIGTSWQYTTNGPHTTVEVNISEIDPYLQNGTWDFSEEIGSWLSQRSVHSVEDSPGPIPPMTSFSEHMVLNADGSNYWLYGDEASDGVWWRGADSISYSGQGWHAYRYPMTFGTVWTTAYTTPPSIPMCAHVTSRYEIVGWGMVAIPPGGPFPCLVRRTLTSDTVFFGGTPFFPKSQRSYEWLVPTIGEVVKIQSVENEPSWYFSSAANFSVLDRSNFYPASPCSISDLTILVGLNDVLLNWSPIHQDINGNPIAVASYAIYRGIIGDGSDHTLIGYSPTNYFVDIGAVESSAKCSYDVRAISN